MGMFDQPKVFSENFEENQPFMLQDMKAGLEISTDYGQGTPTLLKINDEWYSVFGDGIASQLDRMEAGDLPREVMVIRQPTRTGGREVKKLVPSNWQPEAA